MTVPLLIAEKMARALRHMPCSCRKRTLAWPFFSKDDKRADHICAPCEALTAFHTYIEIAQIPGVKPATPEATPEAKP